DVTCIGGRRRDPSELRRAQSRSWIRENRPVHDIEELRSELDAHAFLDTKIFVDREVPIMNARPDYRVAAACTEAERSVNGIRGAVFAERRCVKELRNLLAARATVRKSVRVTDRIRPPLANIGVRAIEALCHGERAAALEGGDAVDLPVAQDVGNGAASVQVC